MLFAPQRLVAMILGASFAAGLNVYATVATLGLLGHFALLPLPPQLHALASWWVIGPCAVLFVIEFFADKIPVFDLLWNAVHTFIRVPIAGVLAWQASQQLSPVEQLITVALASLIAFLAHGGKLAVRTAVTHSPEPVSNIALSLGEDVLAIGLTWAATQHPYIAAAVAVVLAVLAVFAIRMIWKVLKRVFRGVSEFFAQEPQRA